MKKTLVAYFSASGDTARLANTLATVVDGDLFEIVPAQPYTSADLNWNDSRSRSSLEMNDKSSRPAVASTVDVAPYDTIYVGFPIWWYTAPTIIKTFLEQYDLAGKTIIPFATSGSSQIGSSAQDLKPSCPGAEVKVGKRFRANARPEELKAWVETV